MAGRTAGSRRSKRRPGRAIGQETKVTDLKGELATLKIDRSRKRASRWRWPLLLLLPVVVILLGLYALRARQAFSATEIETTTVAVSRDVQPSAGTPILTASGYVVARRKAVVSAKIQGRLSELRVEEGSVVREGETIARLESIDYEAAVNRARAAVLRAEADLAEYVRQLKLSEDLTAQKIVAVDQRDAAASRVKIAEAALAQAQADLAYAEAQLQNTFIRAPFGGVVVKKMAEIGESVAPIPPGVNISTSSGAIVALADLATLEVEADVAEANVAKVGNGQPAEVTVEAIRLETYCDREGVRAPDLLCIDAQGAALRALRGLGRYLDGVRAMIVEIEHREVFTGEDLYPAVDAFLQQA